MQVWGVYPIRQFYYTDAFTNAHFIKTDNRQKKANPKIETLKIWHPELPILNPNEIHRRKETNGKKISNKYIDQKKVLFYFLIKQKEFMNYNLINKIKCKYAIVQS